MGSSDTEEAHAVRGQVLDRLAKLLPAQLEELVLREGIPREYLPGHLAPPMERAVAAVRLIEQQGRLHDFACLLGVNAAEQPREAQRSPPPRPVYMSDEIRALSERIEDAHARKRTLRDAELATHDIDQEILDLRRKLRDGGQLRAGDWLGDGRYLLIKQLGRGGFAVVWEAHDRRDERGVAIKVLHLHLAGDPQRRERFFRGARVMSELAHPGVVRVFEPHGEDESFCYFAMELMLGGNLRDAILSKRVESSRIVSLIVQVGEALAEAHKRQLIHRDVKPANILLDEYGNAKLTDFDLVGAHDTTGGTRTGALGTVVYAAPECMDKPQDATARADVFGLGMTAIFCLSGQDLSMEMFRQPNAGIKRLKCAVSIRVVLMQAVAWNPSQRFPDASAMTKAVRKAVANRRIAWLVSRHSPFRTIIVFSGLTAFVIWQLSEPATTTKQGVGPAVGSAVANGSGSAEVYNVVTPCGGLNQRACCVGEGTPCNPGLVEVPQSNSGQCGNSPAGIQAIGVCKVSMEHGGRAPSEAKAGEPSAGTSEGSSHTAFDAGSSGPPRDTSIVDEPLLKRYVWVPSLRKEAQVILGRCDGEDHGIIHCGLTTLHREVKIVDDPDMEYKRPDQKRYTQGQKAELSDSGSTLNYKGRAICGEPLPKFSKDNDNNAIRDVTVYRCVER